MKRVLLSLLMIGLLCLIPAVSRAKMAIYDYHAAINSRFYSEADKNFIGDPYDFSGVGQSNSSDRWATLVSDNCFISANHYHPGVGETITFYETNDLSGTSYSYTVTGGQRIGTTDLWIGWFDTAVDTSIERYEVLDMANDGDYTGLELYIYGKPNVVGTNTIDWVDNETNVLGSYHTIWYDYDSIANEARLQSGDSGAPSFAVVNSSLALVGVHSAVCKDLNSSIDTFVPAYLDEVNIVITEQNQLPTTVPEPGMFSYLLVISCYLWVQRRHNSAA
ncbi:MAG TPA: hypothetical protein ENL07_04555 [Chlorobaculum parvum]|uniref:Serine protease n=1 Tax=Chlorobaculum parvum TaxID=274539 RepID=A0A7C5HMG2_9CHLB|nr:hypothetical protein [Chlorobaculum parvum]